MFFEEEMTKACVTGEGVEAFRKGIFWGVSLWDEFMSQAEECVGADGDCSFLT